MVERPTSVWRQRVHGEEAALAAGTLNPDDAVAGRLWPDAMIRDTDVVLGRFDTAVAGLAARGTGVVSDEEVFEAIKRAVLALNDVHRRHDAPFETCEREQLCAYVEARLERAGVDVDALAARRRLTRHEITDEWHRW